MRFIVIGLAAALALGTVGVVALDAGGRGLPAEEAEARYLAPADRFVMVDGAQVRVREEGPEGAPVLVMLHGFTYSLESWDALAAELSEEHRVVRYDLLGHGLTGPDPRERYAPGERAAFAGRVLDALGVEDPVLVGNSLGGLVAWRLAAAEPDRLRALVLVSPGAYPMNGAGEEPAPVPPAVATYLRLAPMAGVEASAARVYADPGAVPPGRLEVLRDMMRREGNGEAFVRSLEEFALPDPERDLAGVAVPTLIVWGEEDQVIPASDGERMARALPDARLVTYEGVGHVPQEEAPARLATDIEAFLDELPAAGE